MLTACCNWLLGKHVQGRPFPARGKGDAGEQGNNETAAQSTTDKQAAITEEPAAAMGKPAEANASPTKAVDTSSAAPPGDEDAANEADVGL